MKTIDERFEYDHQPTDVFDLIADATFQLDLIVHLGGKEAEVVERSTTSEGGVRLVTRQRTGVELPGFAKRLIPANTTVTLTYMWEPVADDNSRHGTWSTDIKGAPVSIGGPIALRPVGSGSLHAFGGEVRASVPLVGGKLEAFALDNLRRDLALAAKFTADRLAAEGEEAIKGH
jgi:Protein of unknown function (DUF2505)